MQFDGRYGLDSVSVRIRYICETALTQATLLELAEGRMTVEIIS